MKSVAFSDLDALIDWVSVYLPHQGTLQHFVHHNPLQAFENYSFSEACQIAQKVYKGYSFLEPKRYLEYIQSGKISQETLLKQLHALFAAEQLPLQYLPWFLKLLLEPPLLSNQGLIEKQLKKIENQALVAEIQSLIQSEQAYKGSENPFYFPTYQQLILQTQGRDIDEIINPILAKFLSSYVDPGSAYWRNEYRAQGLWACFKENYKSKYILENSLARDLHLELKRVEHLCLSVDQLIYYYCEQLKLPTEQIHTYLLAMGLRLRGWAGLFNQLMHHPEEALDQTSFVLKEFLLVKLVLEYVVCRNQLGQIQANDLLSFHQQEKKREKKQFETELLFLVLHALNLNQIDLLGQWETTETVDFILALRHVMRFQRQVIYQNALEQTYAYRCLHALEQTQQEPMQENPNKKPVFAYITCIDDREESLRRYLEQTEPECRTFGIAGHFEMNMYFQGFNEVRYRKLCPGVISETFKVQQVELKEQIDDSNTAQKKNVSRMYAQFFRSYSHHSKFSFFSYFITLMTGYLSSIPFFLKVFFPHLDLAFRRKTKKLFLHQKKLVDLIFHAQGNPEGLSFQQGADKVYQLLKTIDLKAPFSDLIYVVGHGSSSINNPHEYAYNCGACGGGKGRANGRVFATIANHPEVRKILNSQYQLSLPESTVFVGGFHDTCKDHVSWFDSSLTPEQKSKHLSHQCVIDTALRLNAAERARKFYNIPDHLSLEKTFEKVQTRSNDLTEARPEYNHATNALCVIGRRNLTEQVFMDRRAFLCSYNPMQDDGQILAKIMGAAIPVCAGINLEYYFSSVDTEVYGCGSKLNHNITNNYAVMSGFASDLRLGLSKQMVEIHDPMRILIVIESKPEIVREILMKNKQLRQLVENKWVRLVVYDFEKKVFFSHQGNDFEPLSSLVAPIKAYPVSQEIEVDSKNLIPVAILGRKYV